jgi:cell division protein FtsB
MHSRGRVFAVRTVFFLLVVGCAYLIFEFGRIQANYNIVDAALERQSYEAHIAELDAEIAALKEVVAKLETDRAVDSESYKEVEANLVTLQAKIQEQADAIAFYRGIVSPADGAAGLRVQDLKLTRAGSERAYNVRLVLVQLLQHDRKVTGDVDMVVQGLQDGNEVSYPFTDLLAGEADPDWEFSFRYFQNFDREIVLPDGFIPQQIKIAVHSKTRSIASIEQSFSWSTSRG